MFSGLEHRPQTTDHRPQNEVTFATRFPQLRTIQRHVSFSSELIVITLCTSAKDTAEHKSDTTVRADNLVEDDLSNNGNSLAKH